MTVATRLETDTAHWIPVAKHYQVDGGYLVVVAAQFMTAEGTEVFYTDETGAAFSMEPIARFPHGTTHEEALNSLGYTSVVDTVVDPPEVVLTEAEVVEQAQESVIQMLPPEILAVISDNINTEGT